MIRDDVVADIIINFLLSLLWFFYWPLLYVRIKGVFSRFSLTHKNLIISFFFAVIASVINTSAGFVNFIEYSFALLLLTIFTAAISITLMILLERTTKSRTHIKIMILAAYLHVFWQVLPGIDIYTIAADLIITGIIIVLAKGVKRRHKMQDTLLTHGSISDLWK